MLTPSSIVSPIRIDSGLRRLTRQWIITLCAVTTLTLGAAAVVRLAGEQLLTQAQQLADWWWHRPEGLVLGVVALLATISVVIGSGGTRAGADKPLYDIR